MAVLNSSAPAIFAFPPSVLVCKLHCHVQIIFLSLLLKLLTGFVFVPRHHAAEQQTHPIHRPFSLPLQAI
jgi:hypothetical protein